MNQHDDDKRSIDAVVKAFFAVFDNRGGRQANLDALHDLCVPECIIVKQTADEPIIYSLSAFVEPREKLLHGGDLVDFSEEELWERTDVFGSVAQRLCVYRKSGVLAGERFEAKGMKSIQLLRTGAGWKICAMAWDDERPGFVVQADERAGFIARSMEQK